MAKKAPVAPAAKAAAKPAAKKRAKKRAKKTSASKATPKASRAGGRPASAAFAGLDPGQFAGLGDLSKMAKAMTIEQAMDLYKANAKIALDIINAALEGTAKMRRLQFEGEENARAMGHKAARRAAEAGSPDALVAAGQSVSQEAIEQAMRYWGQMFELIVEMQKRLFSMMEGQMAGVPGVKEAKAAMALMPDLRQAQNVISAMQGVVSSGGNAFESMQRVMGDFARFMPGMKR